MNRQDEIWLPPKDLIYRVAGTSDPDWFVASGRQSVADFERALGLVGKSFGEYRRILDFGCGCGRIMLPLREAVSIARVTGVDIDTEAIGWLRPRIPDATLLAINELPPMPLADATFDLVYCHSVFTHLDSNYQDRWLGELSRVCKPGATLVVSFSGQTAFQKIEQQWRNAGADPSPLRQQLEDSGILFIADDDWKNGPFPDFYHSTFHTAAYVREHWGRFFRILHHIPTGSLGFQDLVVMEKTATEEDAAGDRQGPAGKTAIPMPPEAFRALVGPSEDASYDNAKGELVFPEVPERLYASVFDFGSGCGRQARQMMQQRVPPSRYVGIDIHRGMVSWCQSHLSVINPNFHFLHQNVFNPGIAPDNDKRLTAPFPVGSGEFTLVNAHSIFTHLYEQQTEFYLREIERILTADGIARTTWFLFDRARLPWLEKWQHCLFVNAEDPTNAVIYDRDWFLDAVRAAGLVVRQTVLPGVPGHQWQVFIEKRREGSVHNFPSAERCADWLFGAESPRREQLTGELERLTAAKQALESRAAALEMEKLGLANEVNGLRNSWSWKLTRPARKLADFLANW
jgi:SAM-dependent methyltransferase